MQTKTRPVPIDVSLHKRLKLHCVVIDEYIYETAERYIEAGLLFSWDNGLSQKLLSVAQEAGINREDVFDYLLALHDTAKNDKPE